MTNEIIIKAIQKINPSAEISVSGDDINTIVWENNTTPIPVADIQAQIPVVEQEIADAATKKATDKASADAKLKALGLTDDEIEAFRS
tara:strand:- start:751 stop:1014 length:264 start_codon:yes stop_codon:yes gene_type:complete